MHSGTMTSAGFLLVGLVVFSDLTAAARVHQIVHSDSTDDDKPDNQDSMTKEEKEEARVQRRNERHLLKQQERSGRGQKLKKEQDNDKPDDWDSMTEEEQSGYKEQRRMERHWIKQQKRASKGEKESQEDKERRKAEKRDRKAAKAASSAPVELDEDGQKLGKQCQRYLKAKRMSGPAQLRAELADYKEVHSSGAKYTWSMPCQENVTAQALYHPNPKSSIADADTSDMGCRFGSINLHQVHKSSEKHSAEDLRKDGNTCCGTKPHFNWIIGTCEKKGGEGQFCKPLPDCAKTGTPKINYVAGYQYNGKEFVMMDDSTAGDIDKDGVSGNYWEGTGWKRVKKDFAWRGGDWTTKYAPWAKGLGPDGPRGVTPPGGLWVLSAENFYYGAFYMLTQLNLNLEGHKQPTESGNCWIWELDPVEGSVGWHWPKNNEGPGNLNMLYGTNNAQTSGCMPISYLGRQMNGLRDEFAEPQMFLPYCKENPGKPGCQPWEHRLDWSGGKPGTQRFEQYWDHPYVFAVVLDFQGSWTYRWIPEEDGSTGWRGINRHSAARTLVNRPRKVTHPHGLQTDVRGDVPEAVILQPSLPQEASCLRSSVEKTNWAFGSEALASMAFQLGEMSSKKGRFAGAQNWWLHFQDTQQMQDYPASIMGMQKQAARAQNYTCNKVDTWECNCKAPPFPLEGSAEFNAAIAEFERQKEEYKTTHRAEILEKRARKLAKKEQKAEAGAELIRQRDEERNN